MIFGHNFIFFVFFFVSVKIFVFRSLEKVSMIPTKVGENMSRIQNVNNLDRNVFSTGKIKIIEIQQ